MGNKILALFLVLLSSLAGHAVEETPNSIQARRIFDTAYNQVFGEQGSKLHYDVNIIGLYKTNGTIWLKGKKQKESGLFFHVRILKGRSPSLRTERRALSSY